MPAVDAASVVNGSPNGVGLYLAPLGSTAPTTADTALNASFIGVGYIKEGEAPTIAQEITSASVRAWQSATDVKSRITGRNLSVGFTLIEATPMSLGLYFSETEPTPAADAFSLTISSTPTVKEYMAVLQMQDGSAYVRFLLNKVVLETTGTIAANREEALALPVTLKALDAGSGLGTVFVKNASAAW